MNILNKNYNIIYKIERINKKGGIYPSSQVVANQVFQAQTSLTSVFGKGTGGPRRYQHRQEKTREKILSKPNKENK